MLEHPALKYWHTHIVTLSPEGTSFNGLGVGYLYEDLTDIPTRDNYYDAVACVSTLEHVGMDNSSYGGEKEHDTEKWKVAVAEMLRVLKPGKHLHVTVPFGTYQDEGWYQQFDERMLDSLTDMVIEYPGYHGMCLSTEVFETVGTFWKRTRIEDCVGRRYETHRGRAGAVACLTLMKGE